MGNRRHSHSRRRRRAPHSKNITLITLVLLLVCVTAIPALAWLTAKSVVKNEFQIGNGDVVINETTNDSVKQNVNFTNNGNVPVYVRANVSIYWKDKDGNIMATVPAENTDYNITWFGTDSGWVKGIDGVYYYTKQLEVGETTPDLIQSVTDKVHKEQYNDGRTFYVDIASQSLQTTPAEAVKEAWVSAVASVDDNGSLVMKTTTTAGGGA